MNLNNSYVTLALQLRRDVYWKGPRTVMKRCSMHIPPSTRISLTSRTPGVFSRETISYANPELVQAHLTLHVCTILLCNVQFSVQPETSSRENVVGAAHAMTRIASCIRPIGTLVPIHAYLNSIVSSLNLSPLKKSC